MNYNILNIISIISLISGIFVISIKNPIVSVLFLIGLFLSIASYLMVLGINFIGLSYLLVYVGAVSILFIFILMLINVRISELSSNSSNSVPLAIMIGVLFNLIIYNLLPVGLIGLPTSSHTINFHQGLSLYDLNGTFSFNTFGRQITDIFGGQLMNTKIHMVTPPSWDGVLWESSHITSIGNIIYTNYPIWLILASLILLLAMVGAIVITIKSK